MGKWPEVMKKSNRDQSIMVLIYLCMEAVLGISLYPYLNYQNHYVFFIIAYVYSSSKVEKG
jgi:hypothetical protein